MFNPCRVSLFRFILPSWSGCQWCVTSVNILLQEGGAVFKNKSSITIRLSRGSGTGSTEVEDHAAFLLEKGHSESFSRQASWLLVWHQLQLRHSAGLLVQEQATSFHLFGPGIRAFGSPQITYLVGYASLYTGTGLKTRAQRPAADCTGCAANSAADYTGKQYSFAASHLHGTGEGNGRDHSLE